MKSLLTFTILSLSSVAFGTGRGGSTEPLQCGPAGERVFHECTVEGDHIDPETFEISWIDFTGFSLSQTIARREAESACRAGRATTCGVTSCEEIRECIN